MSTTEETTTDTRLTKFDEIADGVLAVRAFFADHPELPEPHVSATELTRVLFKIQVTDCTSNEPVADFQRFVRVLMDGAPVGTVTKTVTDGETQSYSRVTRSFGLADLEVWTFREVVCSRTLVGEKTVPVYEYECSPILAGSAA